MDVLLRDGEGDASDATLDVALDRRERLRRGLVQRVELILTPLQPTTHEPGLAPAGFEVVERRDGARRARLHDSQRPGRRSGRIARAGERGERTGGRRGGVGATIRRSGRRRRRDQPGGPRHAPRPARAPSNAFVPPHRKRSAPRQGHVISRISANSRSGRSDIRLSPGRESGFRAQTGGPSPRSRNIHPRVRPQRRRRCDVRRLARLNATDDPTPNGSERREESDGSGPSRPPCERLSRSDAPREASRSVAPEGQARRRIGVAE